MIYADFTYYRDQFMGTAIREDSFPRLALRASQFLAYYTLGKAQRDPELPALKMACCALAEKYQVMDLVQEGKIKGLTASAENAGKEIQSESVGPWSRTYKSGGESAASVAAMAADMQSALVDTARQYLAHTGLLYRGGRC